MRQQAMEGRLLALGTRPTTCCCRPAGPARSLGADRPRRDRSLPTVDGAPALRHSSGPDFRMTSGAVIALAMTLNELCTNAIKFGALSVPAGRVEIAWTLEGTPGQTPQRLHLIWSETNGPPVEVPTKRSFGTRLIETLGRQLEGDVKLTYEPTGFVYALDVPLSDALPNGVR